MRLTIAALAVVAGTSGCSAPAVDSGLCRALARPVQDLRAALEGHPETPDQVGEAGADVVIGLEAGCG